jgi:hypothetical protein
MQLEDPYYPWNSTKGIPRLARTKFAAPKVFMAFGFMQHPPGFDANSQRPLFGQYRVYWPDIGRIFAKKGPTSIWPKCVVLAKYWSNIGSSIGRILAEPSFSLYFPWPLRSSPHLNRI